MLVDSHAHLDMPQFDADRPDVIARARQAGVAAILTLGIDGPSSQRAVALAQEYDGVYAAVGVHPHEAKHATPETYKALVALARARSANRIIAWGEIGLDYHYHHSPPEIQRREFRRQIRLARELDLPICIHSREAHDDVLTILKQEMAADVGVVMHCFSGDVDIAQRCLDQGFYLSFAGPVTFKNARKLPEVVPLVPDDRLLIETDSPYLSPHPWRGRDHRNEPARVAVIAARVAELRGIDVEVLGQLVERNFLTLFRHVSARPPRC
ncbi:MAG TPA: TatD family hydrolase [Alphaproteobacteria bacterium]|nr:TatD family hydrolase [Alphaproteobacteria bacterium]